jgi:hypothetical protein
MPIKLKQALQTRLVNVLNNSDESTLEYLDHVEKLG